MNKKKNLVFFLILILLVNCSFDTKTGIWSGEEVAKRKVAELEKEQKVNIFWRQYNTEESDVEKMNILDKIYYLKPDSQYVTIERGNVYLSM